MLIGAENITISIRRRPWWNWVIAVFSIGLEILLIQTAWASMKEEEYRAASICWIIVAVVAVAGVFTWLREPRRMR